MGSEYFVWGNNDSPAGEMLDSGRGTNVGMVPLGDDSSIFGGSRTMDGCCAVASWRSAGTIDGRDA